MDSEAEPSEQIASDEWQEDDLPLSADDLFERARIKLEKVAFCLRNARFARENWCDCGLAVEFVLKAVLARQRSNYWPTKRNQVPKAEQTRYFNHNLAELAEQAKLDFDTIEPALGAKFKLAFEWHRGHDYTPPRFPHDRAKRMYAAALAILEWGEEQR